MQRRMCGFSGILARGPNLPFVYFFEMEQATKPAPTGRVFAPSPFLPPRRVWLCKLLDSIGLCLHSVDVAVAIELHSWAGAGHVWKYLPFSLAPSPPLLWLRTLAARINCVWWSKVISTALNYYYLQEVSTCSTIIQILCTCPATPTRASSLEHPPSNTHKGCVCIGSV